MTTHTPAPPSDAWIEWIRVRAEKDSQRFGRTVDIPVRADLLLGLLSKLRAPLADERAANDYTPTHDQPHHTGVGEWCAPGPAAGQRRAWLLRFADADRGDCVYYDEQEARRAFAQAEGRGWNCYLFEYARRAALASAPVAGEALRWRVRERRSNDGELLDCFVEAPAAPGMAYAQEVLGDDYAEAQGGIEGKLKHCQMIVAWANAAPEASAEPLARYCPGCGSVGPVGDEYRDCYPDGIQARMIPARLAEQCRDTFRLAIKSLLADAAANDSAAPQASEAVRDAPECEPCNGMGIIDGMGDRCPSCNGSGALSAQPGAQKNGGGDAN